jgi:integrase
MARGSIQKRGDSWTAIVPLPPDPATGKRRQKRITARTKREVEQQAAALIHAAQTGFIDGSKVTISEYLNHWLEAKAPSLRPGTARRYRDLSRLHLAATIGGIRLAKLTAADVQRLYSDLLKTTSQKTGRLLSPTSVRHVHNLLHRALEDAVRWGLVVRNVTSLVDPPRRDRREMQTWNTTEVSCVLHAAANDDLEAFWRLALLTGMRRGELLALKWTDLDLDAGILSVCRSLSRGESSRLVESEPKTQAGRRRIALPRSVVESLRRHKTRQLEYRLSVGPAYHDQGIVFANDRGGHTHPNSVTKRFHRLIDRAGVPRIRFHDLRHTCATLLLAEGVHPKIVQERLGHTDIAMTLNLYSHVTPDMQRQAADMLDAALAAVRARSAS